MEQVTWPGWETLRVIGRGSFGTVYEIRRSVAGDVEHAALKYLSIPASEDEIVNLQSEGMDSASITRTFREQLNDILNEYKLMRKLNDCPNVVRCDDVQYVQKQDGFGWDILIRMELLTPITKQLAGQSEIPEEQVIALGKDLSRALICCEENHILHRDIKPQNIFVSEDGKYKLGDFGIAKAKEKTGTDTARAGTSDYMAPEVYYGEHYDKTADIYSLGIVLYWLLNNRKMPFLPQSSTAPRLQEREDARMRRLKGEALPPPVNGSKGLKRIVLKCCAFKPKDRYADASELLRDLLALKRKPAPKPNKSRLLMLICGVLALAGLFFGGMKLIGARETVSVIVEPTPMLSAVPVTESPSPTPPVTFTPTPVPEPTPTPLTAEELKYVEAENLLASGDKAHAAMAFGALGDYKDARERSFALWDGIAPRNAIAAGYRHTVCILADGTVEALGANSDGQCDVSTWSDIVSVAAGNTHTVGLRKDGTVIASGWHSGGQCDVSDWKDIVSIAAGSSHTIGLKADGTVIATGWNIYDQCNVSEWTDIVAIAAGNDHTIGLKADGTVVATGPSDSRCEVFSWNKIRKVAAGGYHTVGLQDDGKVIVTGYNSHGQCDVSLWNDIIFIDAGLYYTIGLRVDGSVVAVGDNQSGQCECSDWTNITEIAAGAVHTVGIESDGTVIATGDNSEGQCNVTDWTGKKLPLNYPHIENVVGNRNDTNTTNQNSSNASKNALTSSTSLSTVNVGDTIVFGAYEQDNNTSNGKEAIEWYVIGKEKNSLLIVSKYALDCQPYNTICTDTSWEKCSLRYWLNSSFLDSAFNAEEQRKILTTVVNAADNPVYGTAAGNSTQDRIFLLSTQEADSFPTDAARMCVPTPYAIAQGAWADEEYKNDGKSTCWWWLRTSGIYLSSAVYVRSDGAIELWGNDVNLSHDAVRPALMIDLTAFSGDEASTEVTSMISATMPSTKYSIAVRNEGDNIQSYTFIEKINVITESYQERVRSQGTEIEGHLSTGYSSLGYMQNKYGFYYADGELYYAEAREDDGIVQLYYWDRELIAARDFRYGDVEMVAEGSAFERIAREYAWLYGTAMSM